MSSFFSFLGFSQKKARKKMENSVLYFCKKRPIDRIVSYISTIGVEVSTVCRKQTTTRDVFRD